MHFWNRLDIYFRLQSPKITAILVLLSTVVPLHIPGMAQFLPFFVIMMVYYWTIYRSDLFPAWFVFVLGLVQDALYGTPLGVHSFLNLSVWLVITKNRQFFSKESLQDVWFKFFLVSLMVAVLNWGIFCFLQNTLLIPTNAILQWLLSAVLYVCIHYVLNMVYLMLPNRLPSSHA